MKGGWLHLEEEEGSLDACIRNALRICLAFWAVAFLLALVAFLVLS